MVEFVTFVLAAIADYWGQAGQRRACLILGATLIVIVVVWALVARRTS
ncbi:hypothetical protein [Luteibacter rhizovicinus]|nr:hypothetical protein [Luteibacter rhizovicinus]